MQWSNPKYGGLTALDKALELQSGHTLELILSHLLSSRKSDADETAAFVTQAIVRQLCAVQRTQQAFKGSPQAAANGDAKSLPTASDAEQYHTLPLDVRYGNSITSIFSRLLYFLAWSVAHAFGGAVAYVAGWSEPSQRFNEASLWS